MDTLLFALNAVMPIVLIILLGYFLKRIGMLSTEFLSVANKFDFYVCLPAMLFINLYSIKSLSDVNWSFIGFCAGGFFLIFLLGMVVVRFAVKDDRQKGVVLQCIVRSNYAIIGIPLAQALFGESGVISATILLALFIPMVNVSATVALSMYVKTDGKKSSVKSVLIEVIKNPLIIATIIGLGTLGLRALFEYLGIAFRLTDAAFLYTAIDYIGKIATPLALVVLGGQFEFSDVGALKKQIVLASSMRIAIVPAIIYALALWLFPSFGGAEFAALVAMFGAPVAVSSAIMAKEMNNDEVLAGQLVVWTTIFSSLTVFVTALIFKSIGIF